MTRIWLSLVLAAIVVASWGVNVTPSLAQKRYVALDMLSDHSVVKAGQTITVAVRERIDPHWHTYWVNPGDSGEPTTIEWALPDGVSAGPIQWPLPKAIPIGPLTNYGYETEVLLLTDIKVPDTLAPGDLRLAAKVRYLVCKDICIPGEGEVALTLRVDANGQTSSSAGLIETARRAIPVPMPGTAVFSHDSKTGNFSLKATLAADIVAGAKEARFFPTGWGVLDNAAKQPHRFNAADVQLDLKQGDTKEQPATLDGVLALTKTDGSRVGYTVVASRITQTGALGGSSNPTGLAGPDGGAKVVSKSADGSAISSIGTAILFAFLGGLILNLMPCVFPVLALKALSFASAKDGGHGTQGLAYLGGVLASFGVFAGAIAILREGSVAMGWGFQFQSPVFVFGLAILFFVMGLSLSGVVNFGSGLMSAGDSLARKPGVAGYFFTGVLAAIAATPCTAPFMGAAIGYAMTQPSFVLIAILLSLGLGFAAPVFALSLSPSLQRLMPRPGAWMEMLKQVLAFPLYATAAWLVWVLSIQTGSDGVMAAGIALVGVSFAAWLAARTAYLPFGLKLAAPTIGLAAILFAANIAFQSDASGTANPANSASLLKEEPFTQNRLDTLLAEGKPVFVNFTAAWCITCKVNERVALKSETLAREFNAAGIVYLKGDWTKQNPEITAMLTRFGRAGVPLYIFYPGGGAEPRLLPQILTTGLVLDEIKTKTASTPALPAKGV